ncbi:MAG: MFS transporter [Chloroflexi bacterium]|nr:MFS transporter [Chloroflexota bacterium]
MVSEIAFSFAMPFTPLYLQQLGVTDLAEVGLWAGVLAGCFAVAMGGMAPIWGILADRFGHRRMIQRALFGAGTVIGLVAFVQTPEQLLVLRILHGAMTGVVTAIATMVSLTTPRQHLSTVLGLLQAAIYLGITLGPLLGGAFADHFGLRASFGCTGVLLVSLGLAVTFLVPDLSKEQVRTEAGRAGAGGAGRQRLMTRELLAVILLMALTRLAQNGPQPFLPLFVQTLVHTEEGLATTVGILLAATGAASVVSALLIGRLNDRFGARTVLVCGLLLSAGLSAVHALAGTVWQLLVLRIALGLAQGGSGPAIQALMIDVTPPGKRGAAFGVLTTANAVGSGGGPILGSFVAAAFSIPAVFLATAPVLGVAGWLAARLRPTGRSETATPAAAAAR